MLLSLEDFLKLSISMQYVREKLAGSTGSICTDVHHKYLYLILFVPGLFTS